MSTDASRNGSHSVILNAQIECSGEWSDADDVSLPRWESVVLSLPAQWSATKAGWKAQNKVSNDKRPAARSSYAKSVFRCTEKWQSNYSNSARYVPLRRRHMPNHRLDVGSKDGAATDHHQREHDFISSNLQPGHVSHPKRSPTRAQHDPLLGSQNRALALRHWLGKSLLIIHRTFSKPNLSLLCFVFQIPRQCHSRHIDVCMRAVYIHHIAHPSQSQRIVPKSDYFTWFESLVYGANIVLLCIEMRQSFDWPWPTPLMLTCLSTI